MFLQLRHVFVVIFITSSFAAHDVPMKFPSVTFVDEKDNRSHRGNQCEYDHVIEELDELHANIKPLIDKTAMMSKRMRGFAGQKGKREWELEPTFDGLYYNKDYDKRGMRKFLGAKGKKSLHDNDLENRESELEDEKLRNIRYYFTNYPEELEKRARSMFQGIRGKKAYTAGDWEKKAAIKFQSFRGKRSMIDELRELGKQNTLDSQGEKELEEFVRGPYEDYILSNSIPYEKRGPYTYRRSYGKIFADKRLRKGYSGLRGKRNIIDEYGDAAGSRQQDTEFKF